MKKFFSRSKKFPAQSSIDTVHPASPGNLNKPPTLSLPAQLDPIIQSSAVKATGSIASVHPELSTSVSVDKDISVALSNHPDPVTDNHESCLVDTSNSGLFDDVLAQFDALQCVHTAVDPNSGSNASSMNSNDISISRTQGQSSFLTNQVITDDLVWNSSMLQQAVQSTAELSLSPNLSAHTISSSTFIPPLFYSCSSSSPTPPKPQLQRSDHATLKPDTLAQLPSDPESEPTSDCSDDDLSDISDFDSSSSPSNIHFHHDVSSPVARISSAAVLSNQDVANWTHTIPPPISVPLHGQISCSRAKSSLSSTRMSNSRPFPIPGIPALNTTIGYGSSTLLPRSMTQASYTDRFAQHRHLSKDTYVDDEDDQIVGTVLHSMTSRKSKTISLKGPTSRSVRASSPYGVPVLNCPSSSHYTAQPSRIRNHGGSDSMSVTRTTTSTHGMPYSVSIGHSSEYANVSTSIQFVNQQKVLRIIPPLDVALSEPDMFANAAEPSVTGTPSSDNGSNSTEKEKKDSKRTKRGKHNSKKTKKKIRSKSRHRGEQEQHTSAYPSNSITNSVSKNESSRCAISNANLRPNSSSGNLKTTIPVPSTSLVATKPISVVSCQSSTHSLGTDPSWVHLLSSGEPPSSNHCITSSLPFTNHQTARHSYVTPVVSLPQSRQPLVRL